MVVVVVVVGGDGGGGGGGGGGSFSLRASHKSVVVVTSFRALHKSSTLFLCALLAFCAEAPKADHRSGPLLRKNSKTKDVVKDLGFELSVHVDRMQTFWNILFEESPATVNALRSSGHSSHL